MPTVALPLRPSRAFKIDYWELGFFAGSLAFADECQSGGMRRCLKEVVYSPSIGQLFLVYVYDRGIYPSVFPFRLLSWQRQKKLVSAVC